MSEVKEGFLCPICMADLGDDIQLTVHFDEKHSREDPEIVKNIKEMFAKANTKFANKADQSSELHDISVDQAEVTKDLYGLEPSLYNPVSGIHYDIQAENKIEVTAKFDEFRSERAKRVDIRAMDINKLIVRLERLMTQLPSDPMKRRVHEQSVVPWINEKDVALCPSCAKSFGMTRRKHHCRLCGAVMCADCSDLVSFELAQRLINPATISKFHQDGEEQVSPSKTSRADKIMSNLVDLAGFAEAQRHFRSCLHCKEVLDQRDQRLSLTTAPDPELVKYYAQLQSVFDKGHQMSEKYRQMAQSLHNGESMYQIKEVKVLHLQVLSIAETVKELSQKIASLPVEDPKAETLQNRIRIAAINFVKENLIGLPEPPTQEEFEKIKAQKAQEAVKRVEVEKQKAEEAKRKFMASKSSKMKSGNLVMSNSTSGLSNFSDSVQSKISNAVNEAKPRFSKLNRRNTNEVKMGQGFVASVSGRETMEDDPLGQQIHNLKQFIQQAKSAGQFDDARILEANLRDLQEEYRKIKSEEQQELMQNYEDFKDLFRKSSEGGSENFDESNPFFEDNTGDDTNPFKDDIEEENDKNPFKEEVDDEYDKSGKNPFA